MLSVWLCLSSCVCAYVWNCLYVSLCLYFHVSLWWCIYGGVSMCLCGGVSMVVSQCVYVVSLCVCVVVSVWWCFYVFLWWWFYVSLWWCQFCWEVSQFSGQSDACLSCLVLTEELLVSLSFVGTECSLHQLMILSIVSWWGIWATLRSTTRTREMMSSVTRGAVSIQRFQNVR